MWGKKIVILTQGHISHPYSRHRMLGLRWSPNVQTTKYVCCKDGISITVKVSNMDLQKINNYTLNQHESCLSHDIMFLKLPDFRTYIWDIHVLDSWLKKVSFPSSRWTSVFWLHVSMEMETVSLTCAGCSIQTRVVQCLIATIWRLNSSKLRQPANKCDVCVTCNTTQQQN